MSWETEAFDTSDVKARTGRAGQPIPVSGVYKVRTGVSEYKPDVGSNGLVKVDLMVEDAEDDRLNGTYGFASIWVPDPDDEDQARFKRSQGFLLGTLTSLGHSESKLTKKKFKLTGDLIDNRVGYVYYTIGAETKSGFPRAKWISPEDYERAEKPSFPENVSVSGPSGDVAELAEEIEI